MPKKAWTINARAVIRGLLGAALALTMGCGTQVSRLRLSHPVAAQTLALRAEVRAVGVSNELRTQDFSPDSRLVVEVELDALATTSVDLREAVLSIGDGPERRPVATGTGKAPHIVHDGEHTTSVVLASHERVRVWLAFGGFAERATHELPERVQLRFPEAGVLVLSNPGAQPLWIGERVAHSFGAGGAWVQASADESALNLLLLDQRFAVGPAVLGMHAGLGLRMPQFPTPDGRQVVCCNVPLGVDVALPAYKSARVVVAPYVGAEAALLLGDNTKGVHRRTWIGPALGVNLALGRLWPRHGPFPVQYPSSPLGAVNFRLALVQWFGDGRAFPSLGVVGGLSMALGN